MTIGTFLAIFGAALAAVMSGVGSAIGVSMVGQAAAGVTAEDPSKFSKTLVMQALPGTQGVYGLLTAFLVFFKIGVLSGKTVALTLSAGLGLLAACMPMAVVGLISAVYQAKVAISGVALIAKRPEESGKSIVVTVMVETYAILALLISLLAIVLPPWQTFVI